MTNEANLYRVAIEASKKHSFNANKLTVMSMTKANMYAFEQYGSQLDQMKKEADEANAAFAAVVVGKSAQEIVAIITEAGA